MNMSVRVKRASADPLKLKVKHGRLELRINFFRIRVIEDWNKIPSDVKKIQQCEKLGRTYKKLRAPSCAAPNR